MMGGCWQHLLVLWMMTVGAMDVLADYPDIGKPTDENPLKNLTNMDLHVIPPGCNSSSVTRLLLGGNHISLNDTDRLALASYPKLTELYLDGNNISSISAKYFSVVPQLTVLSLSRNQIDSVDSESLSGLDELMELDLSYNHLTDLCSQLFKGTNELKTLNLQGNPWNCSCSLMNTIKELKAAEGGTTCASPKELNGKNFSEAAAKCSASSPPPLPRSTENAKPHKTATFPKPVLSPTPNSSITTDNKPLVGNSWKFAAGVAVAALFICMLIVGAFKGPSWYKLLHNYRHQRLQGDDESVANVSSTIFSDTGEHMGHQTFTFGQNNRHREHGEEDEDGYFEDPYVRKED